MARMTFVPKQVAIRRGKAPLLIDRDVAVSFSIFLK